MYHIADGRKGYEIPITAVGIVMRVGASVPVINVTIAVAKIVILRYEFIAVIERPLRPVRTLRLHIM